MRDRTPSVMGEDGCRLSVPIAAIACAGMTSPESPRRSTRGTAPVLVDTKEASRWHSHHRAAMHLYKNGAHNARRSMLRYAEALPPGSEERDIVENAAKYFGKHRDRMR